MRWLLMLVEGGVASAITGCVSWPLGARLDAGSSGLVGEWAAPPVRGSTDTIVWVFGDNGRYEIRRAIPSRGTGAPATLLEVGRGRWEAYHDARGGPRPLVCFDRRGRRWPSCRSFRIDSMTNLTGRADRVLIWDGWVSEKRRTSVTLTERVSETQQSP